VSHSITEKLTDCECGKEGSLKRIPSLPFHISVKEGKSKPGQIVKEFIEDAKKEVAKHKKEMTHEVDDV
tara:strand:+ start:90 stop:296 length:207 start_codon:yes stop_codon:yes gene_type:complete